MAASADESSLRCQVPHCLHSIPKTTYHRRYKICNQHATADTYKLNGTCVRWCQQCGKFQNLEEFDGDRRTCARKLEQHNESRRRARQQKNNAKKKAMLKRQARAAARRERDKSTHSPTSPEPSQKTLSFPDPLSDLVLPSGSRQSSGDLPLSNLGISDDDSFLEDLFEYFGGDEELLGIDFTRGFDEPAVALTTVPTALPETVPQALTLPQAQQPTQMAPRGPYDDVVVLLSFSLFKAMPESLPPAIRADLAEIARSRAGIGTSTMLGTVPILPLTLGSLLM